MVFLASSVHIYVPTFALIGSGDGEKVYSVKMGHVFSFVLLLFPYASPPEVFCPFGPRQFRLPH